MQDFYFRIGEKPAAVLITNLFLVNLVLASQTSEGPSIEETLAFFSAKVVAPWKNGNKTGPKR